jgi:hypothetical protein
MPKFKSIPAADLAKALGANLKAQRGPRHQGIIAVGAGVALRVYADWEAGKKLPSLRKLLAVANFHKLPVKELLP